MAYEEDEFRTPGIGRVSKASDADVPGRPTIKGLEPPNRGMYAPFNDAVSAPFQRASVNGAARMTEQPLRPPSPGGGATFERVAQPLAPSPVAPSAGLSASSTPFFRPGTANPTREAPLHGYGFGNAPGALEFTRVGSGGPAPNGQPPSVAGRTGAQVYEPPRPPGPLDGLTGSEVPGAAGVMKLVGPDGRVTYTNDMPGMGAFAKNTGTVSTVPGLSKEEIARANALPDRRLTPVFGLDGRLRYDEITPRDQRPERPQDVFAKVGMSKEEFLALNPARRNDVAQLLTQGLSSETQRRGQDLNYQAAVDAAKAKGMSPADQVQLARLQHDINKTAAEQARNASNDAYNRTKDANERGDKQAEQNIKLDKEWRDLATTMFGGDAEEAAKFTSMVTADRALARRQLTEAKARGAKINEQLLEELNTERPPSKDELEIYRAMYNTHKIFEEADSSAWKQAGAGALAGAGAGAVIGAKAGTATGNPVGIGLGTVIGTGVGTVAGGISGYQNRPEGFTKGALGQFGRDELGFPVAPQRIKDEGGTEYVAFGKNGPKIPAEVYDSQAARIFTAQPLSSAPWNRRPGLAVDQQLLGGRP